jgi:biotin carboxylase
MGRLLVLGAGILQIPIIKKAKELGHYVVAADGCPDAPGLEIADKPIVANIVSEEIMLSIAREENIDGVIHPCSEVAMNVMGRINDELGLSGIGKDAAVRATNKHLMRKAFETNGAPSPKSYLLDNSDHGWELFSMQFNSDAILKPSRNSGSRGISKVEKGISKEEFTRLYEVALDESRDKSVLLEQFVEGPEFSVELIVWQNEVTVIAVTDKKTTGAPHFVELGHSQPSCYPDEIVNRIKNAAIAGVKALGVNACACHAEVKVQAGNAYLMEVGARLGGDFISTILTPVSTGIDMVGAAIDCALGIRPDLNPKTDTCAVCIRYFCPIPGKLVSISDINALSSEHVLAYEIYVREGDEIYDVTSSLHRSGHVIVVARDKYKVIELAEGLVEDVKFITI